MATTTVTYLISELRTQLGDLDSTQYRYLDVWLESTLLGSVRTLQRWWNFRYLLNETNEVYRNPLRPLDFMMIEPPVIQDSDVRPIILMASVIIKKGSLENYSWSLGSWRDAELAYSNLEGGRQKNDSLKQDWDELINLIPPPVKQIPFVRKMHLPGFTNNPYDR